jgi:hypothetical protein
MKLPRFAILPLLALAGCVNEKESAQIVAPNPFNNPTPVTQKSQTSFPQANVGVAAQVHQLGGKILAANPQIGLRPFFCAIGSQSEEIFHQGNSKVVITEGLIRKCKNEGELAALLSRELGKMVAEREALATPDMRNSGRRPPPQVEFGHADDGTQLAELAIWEQKHPKPGSKVTLPPDPMVLARGYMRKAGYPERTLDETAPLFKMADNNSAWERQMNAPPPARPFTH